MKMVDGCFNPFGVAKNIFRPLAPDQSASQELKDDWMHFETLWGVGGGGLTGRTVFDFLMNAKEFVRGV
jgi:hypothetical protein